MLRVDSKSSRLRATLWKAPQPPLQTQISPHIAGGSDKQHLVQVYTASSLRAGLTKQLFPSLQPVTRFALRVLTPEERTKRHGVSPPRQRKLSTFQRRFKQVQNRVRLRQPLGSGHLKKRTEKETEKRKVNLNLRTSPRRADATHLVVERRCNNKPNKR